MAIPYEFTHASLSIRAGSQIVLFAISIDINPHTSVIEEAWLLSGNLIEGILSVKISLKDIDVTIGLAGGRNPSGTTMAFTPGKTSSGITLTLLGHLKALESTVLFKSLN